MAIYEFECSLCGERFERSIPCAEYREPECVFCGGKTEQVFINGSGGFNFKMYPGKWTGMYDYDRGKKATWDLTVPGKMDILKKDGTIRDPFESKNG